MSRPFWDDESYERWKRQKMEEMMNRRSHSHHEVFGEYDGHLEQCEDGVFRLKEEKE